MTKLLFILAFIVTWLGFENVELKKLTGVTDAANVNDQAPTPPNVTCYEFKNWIGSADYVTSDTIIRANYEKYKYILSIDPEPEMVNGTVVAEDPYTFDKSNLIVDIPCGTTISVRAVPAQGYKLSKWFLNDKEVNTTETTIAITLDESTVEDGNIAVRATFVEDSGTAIVQTNANANAAKVIRDGRLFIIRDGKTYNVMGAEVR